MCVRHRSFTIVAQNPGMAPSVDEAYVQEHCKVLPGLPIVLDTPGLVEEVEQAEHLFARSRRRSRRRKTRTRQWQRQSRLMSPEP